MAQYRALDTFSYQEVSGGNHNALTMTVFLKKGEPLDSKKATHWTNSYLSVVPSQNPVKIGERIEDVLFHFSRAAGAWVQSANTAALRNAWEIHSNYTNIAPSQQAHLFRSQ